MIKSLAEMTSVVAENELDIHVRRCLERLCRFAVDRARKIETSMEKKIKPATID